jgi:hypothetical protein
VPFPKLYFEVCAKAIVEYFSGPGNLTAYPNGGGLKLVVNPLGVFP